MSSFRCTTRKPGKLERGDFFISTERMETYDKYARNLHHPRYRADFNSHYNDLFRANMKFHDLNYPAPPRETIEKRTMKFYDGELPDSTTQMTSTNLMSSHMLSSSSLKKSKYMTSRRSSMRMNQKNIKEQFIEKLKMNEGQPFADQEKIVADIVRALMKGDVDVDTIQSALEDVNIEFNVNEETSELEIVVKL